MFSASLWIEQYKTEKYFKELSLNLSMTENGIEKLLLVRFLFPFLFRQMVEKLCILFEPHCIISDYTQDYELKFSTQTNFDTLISNLKFWFE